MTNLLQISLNFSSFNKVHDGVGKRRSFSELKVLRPINCYSLPRRRIKSFHQNGFKLRDCDQRWSSLVVRRTGDEILVKGEWEYRKRRVVLVKGLGLNGGGGRDNRTNARILGNLALAIGLTYLSVTGQLGWILDAIGWILDAIVSLWVSSFFLTQLISFIGHSVYAVTTDSFLVCICMLKGLFCDCVFFVSGYFVIWTITNG